MRRARAPKPTGKPPEGGYVRFVDVPEDVEVDRSVYPFNVPAVMALGRLDLDRHITIFVGENGSGKSTLIEAIAVAIGLNPEGGSKHFTFSTHANHSQLGEVLRAVRGPNRELDAYFVRAESFYNVATHLEPMMHDDYDFLMSYGGKMLHEQSHGESFLAAIVNRFGHGGVYVLDEPESALSPARQIALLSVLDTLTTQKASQIIMATHSPILMAHPLSRIYHLGPDGIEQVPYEETEHYKLTRAFLNNPGAFLHHLGVKSRSQ